MNKDLTVGKPQTVLWKFCMDELKRLHDEYTEKYEHTRGKDREDVWKEYIQKNKDLLG